VRDRLGGIPWSDWDEELSRRSPAALASTARELADEISFHRFVQTEVALQWASVRKHARQCSVSTVGDKPIYVAHDSADVWAHPELFLLDPETREPSVEAGVPPDPFYSDSGQHWGNPVYDWARMRANDYIWWTERFRHAVSQYDWVRLDHFCGFESFWVIPPGQPPSAGRYLEGPGRHFFCRMRERIGRLPFYAEDLGNVTPEVNRLRDEFGFGRTFVLQFGFSDPQYLPERCVPNAVMYTSTHDSDTSVGWYRSASEGERKVVHDRIGQPSCDGVHWDLIGLAWASPAGVTIAPLQDVLGLGSAARMNVPGTTGPSNWSWRFHDGALAPELRERLRSVTRSAGRGHAPMAPTMSLRLPTRPGIERPPSTAPGARGEGSGRRAS
jgi:4-alpha-glucanotransferase